MKTLIFTLTLFSAFLSSAAGLNASQVAQLFYSAQSNVTIEEFSSNIMSTLPNKLYKDLHKAAFDQAQIWGDTILEGDYVADGKTDLDTVLIIKQEARVVGYAVTYSERAWSTADCAYVHNDPKTLVTCEEGRIEERSFLTADLNEAEVDQNQFADFKSND